MVQVVRCRTSSGSPVRKRAAPRTGPFAGGSDCGRGKCFRRKWKWPSSSLGRVSLDLVFHIANGSVLPAWALLLFAPRARITRAVVHGAVPFVILALAYGVLLATDRPGPQGANFTTLTGVTNIFTSPQTVIAAWMHYLVFDLFVGAWEGRDAARRGIPHLAVAPCQLLTFLFGPLGLASYLVLRAAWKRRVSLFEED